MAEFQKVMRQWNRMCNSVPDKLGHNLCSDKKTGYICPMHDCGLCNKSVKNQTDNDRLEGEKIIMAWAAEHPGPVYPKWGEWLAEQGVVDINVDKGFFLIKPEICKPIPANIAEKLGIEPKGE